jgi:hypothetical protein
MSIRDTDFVDLGLKCIVVLTVMVLLFYICFITAVFVTYESPTIIDKYELQECKNNEN